MKSKSKQLTIGMSSIDINTLQTVKKICGLLLNSTKGKILQVISNAGEKGIFVQKIEKITGLSQSHTSQYLGNLKKANLVSAQYSGKFVIYRINAKAVKEIEMVIEFAQKKIGFR